MIIAVSSVIFRSRKPVGKAVDICLFKTNHTSQVRFCMFSTSSHLSHPTLPSGSSVSHGIKDPTEPCIYGLFRTPPPAMSLLAMQDHCLRLVRASKLYLFIGERSEFSGLQSTVASFMMLHHSAELGCKHYCICFPPFMLRLASYHHAGFLSSDISFVGRVAPPVRAMKSTGPRIPDERSQNS